ncbi:Chloroperoxidase [Phaeosphaeriaceae sp. PMI808]|nr:Chloroperoxidase [Phaeosphaeriaceae sp. PMI808]
MKCFMLLLFLAASVCAYGDFSKWRSPHDGDVRSPCPALNSLANHGILPRDGRNYNIPIVVKAFGGAINVSAEVATSLAKIAISLSSDPRKGMFNLDDLNKHNVVEHDGSLSRLDHDLGSDSQTFNSSIFDETLSYFNGASEVGIPEVAAARWGRLKSSQGGNSQFLYGSGQRFSSYFESGAYYQLFKNPATSKASVNWIKVFFKEERFPYNEGWRPVNRIDGLSIADTTMQLALHTPEKLPSTGGL